jgi:hypothetical protein
MSLTLLDDLIASPSTATEQQQSLLRVERAYRAWMQQVIWLSTLYGTVLKRDTYIWTAEDHFQLRHLSLFGEKLKHGAQSEQADLVFFIHRDVSCIEKQLKMLQRPDLTRPERLLYFEKLKDFFLPPLLAEP